MSLANVRKITSKGRIIIAALMCGAVMIAALLFFFNKSAGVSETGRLVTEDGPAAEPAVKKLSDRDIEEIQMAAARAAVTGKPVSGKVTERPDYVSEIEWDVFQNVIKNQPDADDGQLTVLVNKLLFFKKKEAWESSGTDGAQRRELAGDLLEMLPFMAEGGYLDAGEAKRLESSCRSELRR